MRKKTNRESLMTAPYLSIPEATQHNHIIRLPASLGKLVAEFYEAGEFKSFGTSKLIQLKAKEGV